ncbi:acfc51b8-d707-40d1-9f36-f9500cde1042 [Sclerotinia trifoliorum]|uniref:Acfc51b8-d707-40d1-9f36-f9500cde1042 n=1 Tax=Sclerotinia trifoliorum TaxID=28548 RepID=A0A8H2VLF8_9HELO|nr:acfc51b8-d707-40d1-9f36-f9500cde1042 [Sclerotinia trifoliorum]
MMMWLWRYDFPEFSLGGVKKMVGFAIVYRFSEGIFEECREEWNRIKKTPGNEVVASESGMSRVTDENVSLRLLTGIVRKMRLHHLMELRASSTDTVS